MAAIADRASALFDRRGPHAVGCVLVLAFATGGSSRGHGIGDALAQLVSLPLLGWAVLVLSTRRRTPPMAPLLVAGALVLVLAALQLPIPLDLWRMPDAREALAHDLALAGVTPQPHWSLAPLASERALWSVLPALAVFVGALALDPPRLRWMLLLVVLLAAASLLLGVVQMTAPRDSIVNPYPQWAPAFNGIFENPNHQAQMLALAAMIVASLHWGLRDATGRVMAAAAAWIAVGGLLFLAVPLTGSRAGVGLAVIGVAAALVARRAREHRSASLRLGTGLLLGSGVAAAAWAAWSWPAISGSVRWQLAAVTATLGRDHAPLGAGTGTFVAWFDQAAPRSLVQWEYFNHAHDEYVQWWFELGFAGIACVAAVVAIVVACRPRRDGTPRTFGIALAGWLGCVMLLLHSLVDYVLRTPALLTVGALLAAAMVAGAWSGRRTSRPDAKAERMTP